MPIRPRISDPYGQEARDFKRRQIEGPPPKAPPKPSAIERKPLLDALESIPVGRRMPHKEWKYRWLLPFMRKSFTIWGTELYLYPTEVRDNKDCVTCTGVLVGMKQRDRRGQLRHKQLLAVNKRVWYGEILRWIQETKYE